MKFHKFAWTSIVAAGAVAAGAVTADSNKSPGDFDWTTIDPSWDLTFTPCYDDFACARLRVPLDWLEDDAEQRMSKSVVLAIIKLAAVVSPHDVTYGGAVLINPGGPGDSGVLDLLRNGRYVQNMMDSDEKHFDMISFDPRGMGFSTPVADCFANEAARKIAFAFDEGFGGPDPSSNASLARFKALDAAMSLQCAAYTLKNDGFSIQEYMSTASVARDMLHMIDQIDDLRYTSHDQPNQVQLPLVDKSAARPPAKLQYYGTSYGTILGQFFLSMYPGRVHRMVLDGVVHPGDWVALDTCADLVSTTEAFDYFYQTCFNAGVGCPLRQPSDDSWQSIKARVEGLITHLNHNPIAMADPTGVPFVIDGQAVRSIMMDPVYAPLLFYERLATTLAAAFDGNYTGLFAAAGAQDLADSCTPRDTAAYKWMILTNMAVRCSDGDDITDRDFDTWRQYITKCEETSPEIGRGWGAGCAGWKIRPRFRFTGPFTSPPAESMQDDANAPSGDEHRGRPSAPVLFLSGRIDPVTPLRSARRAAALFPGATVLVQNSVGHCTVLGSPSRCTNEKVRAYMARGEMPAEGTECEADCEPFKPCPYPLFQLPR